MIRKIRAIQAVPFLLAAMLPCLAQVSVPKLELHRTRLANGLRVIVVPDHAAPVYAIDVAYNVGSRSERPGRTGFAHLFEHMMFQGSANVGKGEHMMLVMNNGGNMNGTTDSDRTTYFEELPKNQLDLGLFLEADRMRSLNVNQANLDNQRNAVQEERRQGIDNQPYGRANVDLDKLSYDGFAYGHPTIGSMRDLDHASLADVQAFFRTYYAPNNAVLTLVGDFDPSAALAKVEQYFGAIPAQAAPPAENLIEGPHYGERRETIEDPLAKLPEVDIAYHIPPGDTAGNFAARELAIILGQGESSRLYRQLVKQSQLASQVVAYADSRIGTSQFYISANPRPGVTAAALEKGIDAAVARLAQGGVTAAELAKAKTQLLRRAVEQRRSVLFDAVFIGDDAVLFHDPELINTQLSKEDAVTLAEIDAAAKKYLVTSQRTVIVSLPAPAEEANAPTGAAAAGGHNTPLSQVVQLHRAPVNRQALQVKLPRPTVVKLGNGLTVALLENHTLPTVAFTLRIRPGQFADPAGLPGLASFTASMLREGTETRTSAQIADQVDALGASLEADSPFGENFTGVSASGLSNTAPQLLALMSDIVLHPIFPAAELAKFQRRQQADLQQNLSSPYFLAARGLARAIYGDFPAGTISPTRQSIARVTVADLRRFHDQHYRSGNSILGVTGDFQTDAMVALVKRYFGGWSGAAEPLVAVTDNTAPRPAHILLIDRPGSVQTMIEAGSRGVRRQDPRYYALTVMNRVLGGGPQARLFMDLRAVHGYTYGAYSNVTAGEYPGDWQASAPVRTAVTDGSMRQLLYEFRRIGDEAVPATELAGAQRSITASFALSLERPQAVLGDWLTVLRLGLPMDYWDRYSGRVAAVDAAAVQGAGRRFVDPDHLQWVCVGDAKQIAATLRKYGPVTVVNANGAAGVPGSAGVPPAPH